MAESRVMTVAAKMRTFRYEGSTQYIRGGGATVVIMTVHFNAMTAKKAINEGATAFKGFFDDLAMNIIIDEVRFLTGDFSMALWHVIVELRARGFQANLAAWYPWRLESESCVRMDSCCIVVIGPCRGAKLLYDPSDLNEGCGLVAQPLPRNWEKVVRTRKDSKGRDVEISIEY